MSIILAIPYVAPTRSISVRNPDLGDSDTISIKLDAHKLMNGNIKTYIKTPTCEKFTWHFIELTVAKAQELEDFLIAASGQDIQLTDFNSVVWKVRCTTEPLEFVTRGRGRGVSAVNEALEISLVFEVVP